MSNIDNSNKKNTKLHLSISSKMLQQLEEMASHYGVVVPEMIRMSIARFYNGEYRKEAFGYSAPVGGVKSGASKGPGRPLGSVEAIVQQVDLMTNDEVTAWLIAPENTFLTMKERNGNKIYCRTNPETGEREIYAEQLSDTPEFAYKRTLMDWPLFISELRKHLKKEKRDGKLI